MTVGVIWMNCALSSEPDYNYSTVEIFKNPYNIISLCLKDEQFQGHMAHPSMEIKTINVDGQHQKILVLSDLFSDKDKALKIIADYSKTYFLKKLAEENLPRENFLMRVDMIKIGTSAELKNYQFWNIVPGYLRIVFNRAQVSPSYYGIQTVDIPLSLLADFLNEKYFPIPDFCK